MLRSGSVKRRRWASAPLWLAVVVVGCAKIEPPSGGPEDKTPPVVLAATPPDSAVNVGRRTPVRIRFSERMNRGSVERALFISPYPEPYPRLGWSHGDRLLSLRFEEPLDANRTYVVTVGSAARDAHNNRIASSFTFAFGTGTHLNSGRILGSVWDAALRPAVGATVGLYDLRPRKAGPDPEKVYPLYTTQVGEDGGFSFGYLGAGNYRVLAWRDRQADELIGRNEEQAVAAWDVALGEGATQRVPRMRISPSDGEPPALSLVRATDRAHVAFQFSEKVPADSLRVAISTPDTLDATAIPRMKPDRTVIVRTSRMRPGRTYGVALAAADLAGNRSTWGPDTTLFDAVSAPDTSAPHVTGTAIPQPIVSDSLPYVTLWFDDVLGAVAFDSLVVLHDSVRVPGKWRLDGVNRLTFRPEAVVPPGRSVWRIPLGPVRDASGNRRSDTATVRLTRVPPDSLGELAGVVIDSAESGHEETGRVVVEARPLHRPWRSRTSVRADTARKAVAWSFTNLPAGEYLLVAWRDGDGDGAWSPGSAYPFRPSERWTVSDTLHVRARWRTTGARIIFH